MGCREKMGSGFKFLRNLSIELYPNSANCYDSLAECYWKSGELDLAIKNYERALAMDPADPTGANATRML